MNISRAESRSKVEALVAAFERNREHYVSGEYDEAKLRVEFLDPFFASLGWDVRNKRHLIGDDCEVLVEDRTRVRGHRRRPDYGFRIGRQLKFFVEAKRPSKSIEDPEAAFQIKTSAWAGGAPLGLLTNFAHLRGFDGLVEPSKDAPEAGILPDMDIGAERYLESFDLLFDTLSRDAVAEGNLDRFLERERRARRGPRRTTILRPMDDAFLLKLEQWRKDIAEELARRNHLASSEALADATQRILDRVVFLRVCEDRGIEPREPLRTMLTEVREDRRRSLYPALVKLFRRLAPQYNGTLFAEHPSEKLRFERDDILDGLIAGLYDPAPYRFDFVRPDFLGSVYERFLGSTIRLTEGGRAKVEGKPEVRHAGGVYYTPRYIVDAIIDRTLGPLVEGKTPDEMLDLRIVDPACGSGSFLLAAFQYLVEKHEAYYQRTNRLTRKEREQFVLRDGVPCLTVHRKQEILTNCIFGVDVDAQAVEVAQMSLYLQLLAGERDDTLGAQLDLRATYLPSLVSNIRRGNSLLAPHDFDAQQDWTRGPDLHAFDWKSMQGGFGRVFERGGFDAVVGNPPYVRIQELKKWAPREAKLYKEKFVAAKKGNFDLYVLFVEQALNIARPAGRVGFIVPHKFFQAKYGEGIRGLLAERKAVAEVVDFGDAQVFQGATTYTCLLFLTPGGTDAVLVRQVTGPDNLAVELKRALIAPPIRLTSSTLNQPTWDLRASTVDAPRLERTGSALGQLGRIYVGLQTSADAIFLLTDPRPAGTGVVSLESKEEGRRVTIEKELLHPILSGRHVKRFAPLRTEQYVLFPYVIARAEAALADERTLRDKFPFAFEYLVRHKDFLQHREHGRFSGPRWYAFRPQNLAVQSLPKLCIPSLVSRPQGAADLEGAFFLDNVDVCAFADSGADSTSPLYKLAIINSALLAAFFRAIAMPFRGGFYRCNRQTLKRFPIRALDLSAPQEKAEHDALVTLVERMMDLKCRCAAPNPEPVLDAAIEAADREIDDRVYRLYGITDDDRRRIEDELGSERAPSGPASSREAALAKLRAHFGEWTGPQVTYEEMKQARRELWDGYVEPEKTDDA